MEASTSALDTPGAAPPLRGRAVAGMRWAAWSLATAIPILSAAPWLVLSWRRRQGRHLVTAAIYLIWPLIGALIAGVVSGLFVGQFLFGAAMFNVSSEQGNLSSLILLNVWLAMWGASIYNAQLEWRATQRGVTRRRRELETAAQIDHDAVPRSRPYWVCLFFWASFGWLGAHRFYTGRWISGLFYTATLGFGGAGWGADMFLLRRLLLDAPAQSPTEAQELAPWALEGAEFGWLDFALRLPFFCVAPFLFVELCVYFHHLELLVALILVVVTCGLMGNVSNVLKRLELLDRFPLTRPASMFFRNLHNFYTNNQPRSFLYYLILPILAPALPFLSLRARRELWLYGKFLLTIFGLLAFQQLMSFGTRYRYMSVPVVGRWLALHLAFATAVTMFFLVPIITTAFTFKLAGKQQRLKLLSVIVLITTIPLGGLTYYAVNHLKTPTLTSWMMLRSRMKSPRFRSDLELETEIFLKHYLHRVPELDAEWQVLHTALTDRYRQHLRVILEADESKALEIRLFHDGTEQPWLGVVERWRLARLDESRTLFAMTPQGQLYSSWSRQPPRVEALFQALAATPPAAAEFRVAVQSIGADQRLYDHLSDFLWNEAGPLEHVGSREHPAFQARLSHLLKRTLHAEGFEDAENFRVFGWSNGPRRWLGIRDPRRVWLLANAEGQFFYRWDRPSLTRGSAEREMLLQLEQFDPAASLDFHLEADRELAKDLLREHSQAFVADAALALEVEPPPPGEPLDEQLSRAYRDYISGLVPRGQLTGLHVALLSHTGERPWLGIYYLATPLFAGAADHFYLNGPAAPPEVAARLQAAGERFAR